MNKAWLNDHVNDTYVKLAQKEGFRARAAYKLKEIDEQFGRNHVRRAGAGVYVRHLERRRREMRVALVPARRGEFGQRRRGVMDRVVCALEEMPRVKGEGRIEALSPILTPSP